MKHCSRFARRLQGFALLASLFAGHASAALTVTEGQAKKAAVEKPAPGISPMARQLKVSGHVEIAVDIAEDGSVEDAKPVTGNPLLVQGVIAAVKKWKFTPFEDGGKAVKATTTLSFDFKQ